MDNSARLTPGANPNLSNFGSRFVCIARPFIKECKLTFEHEEQRMISLFELILGQYIGRGARQANGKTCLVW
jgi:hypothetical protein